MEADWKSSAAFCRFRLFGLALSYPICLLKNKRFVFITLYKKKRNKTPALYCDSKHKTSQYIWGITLSMSIGVFDSGVGGLSVWAKLREHMPSEATVYFADQANFPYGVKSSDKLQRLCESAVDYLLSYGVRVIVIACNTASAVALKHLRAMYSDISFVGMEPAVKPAVAISRSQVIAVLATPVTLEGELLEALISRYAGDVRVVRVPGQELVDCVEKGEMPTRELLDKYICPCLGVGADTLVLGCTHYSFLSGLIKETYSQLKVVDPSESVARQVKRVMNERAFVSGEDYRVEHILATSGSVDSFRGQCVTLLGQSLLEGGMFIKRDSVTT